MIEHPGSVHHDEGCHCIRFTLPPSTDAPMEHDMGAGDVLGDAGGNGAVIIDVTGFEAGVDRRLFESLGEPVLVCFGNHGSHECPLSHDCPPWTGLHGITLEIAGDDPDHIRLARRLKDLVRIDQVIRVMDRNARRTKTA